MPVSAISDRKKHPETFRGLFGDRKRGKKCRLVQFPTVKNAPRPSEVFPATVNGGKNAI